MSKEIQTPEQRATERFAKCMAFLRKTIDANSLLNEYPEAKECIFQRYLGFAQMLCKNFEHLSEELLVGFVRIINGDKYDV